LYSFFRFPIAQDSASQNNKQTQADGQTIPYLTLGTVWMLDQFIQTENLEKNIVSRKKGGLHTRISSGRQNSVNRRDS
jgi:hypothetical protein